MCMPLPAAPNAPLAPGYNLDGSPVVQTNLRRVDPPCGLRYPQVDSWVDFATTFSAEHVAGVDRHLSGRSFLAGGAFSLADVAAYFACAGVVAAADASFSKKNFSRW